MANGGQTINFAQSEVVIPPAVPPSWGDVTGKPETFPSAWTDVSGKPSTFAPAEHDNLAHNPDYLDASTPISSSTVIPHTWVVPNAVTVPTGTTDSIPPMIVSLPTGRTAKLLSLRRSILGGTSATFKLQRNGADITGYTGLSATTTIAQTDATDVTLTDGDKIQPIVTAVSGSPVGLSISLVIEYGG